MGAILFPKYAMLSMGYFKRKLYRMCINEFSERLG